MHLKFFSLLLLIVPKIMAELDFRTLLPPEKDNSPELRMEKQFLMLEEEFKVGAVSPDFIPNPPKKHCNVEWGEVKAYAGNLLHRSMIMTTPNITWGGKRGALYTLILFHTYMTPYRKGKIHSLFKEWKPYVVGNIPGRCNVQLGEILWPYHMTNDPRDTWLHKHIAVVYKQNSVIIFKDEDKYKPGMGPYFNITDFTNKYQLGDPEFGNFCYSDTELGLEPLWEEPPRRLPDPTIPE